MNLTMTYRDYILIDKHSFLQISKEQSKNRAMHKSQDSIVQ